MNILITGGTSALGQAIVERLAPLRHTLTVTYCSNRSLAERLSERWSNVTVRHLDFTDRATVQALADEVPAMDIDVLVNNAYFGRPLGTHFHRTRPEAFAEAFATNVMPVIGLSQACVSAMRRRHSGTLINIGTLATEHVAAGYSAYAATKAYLQQLALAWQCEYAAVGIRAFCVQPDFMATSLHGDMLERLAEAQRAVNGRLLTVRETAEVVASIIDDPQSFDHVLIPVRTT